MNFVKVPNAPIKPQCRCKLDGYKLVPCEHCIDRSNNNSPTPDSSVSIVDPTSETLGPMINTGVIYPLIQPLLSTALKELTSRQNVWFHFWSISYKKQMIVDLYNCWKRSWTLNSHGCTIGRGCFWESHTSSVDKETDTCWSANLKIKAPSDLLLNVVSEYLLSCGFSEHNVYHVSHNYGIVLKLEYKAK